MSGYTPVFQSIFTGTLCGRYPDTAAWMFFLALADKHGVVDMTPEYISSVTGMPVDDLLACIRRFTEPDARSRSGAEEGRRLVPLSVTRSWGWQIVNHALYRERARLMAKSEREVGSGANAERLRTAHTMPETAGDRRGPPGTAGDRLSDANTNADSNLEKNSPPSKTRSESARARKCPGSFEPDRSFALSALPDIDVETEILRFRDHEFRVSRSDWAATWRNWVRTCKDSGQYARKPNGNGMTWPDGRPVRF